MSGIHIGVSGLKALQLIFACAVVAACAASPSHADAIPGESANGLIDDESSSNSTLRFQSQNSLTSAPSRISAGNGYYASHPISYGSGIGSSISIADRSSGTSMHHEVDSAHELIGEREIIARESSYRHGDFASGSSSTINMRVNENVTEGRVHIGVLKGSGAPGSDPFKELLKNPELEIDEDYVGTYHIEKNMTISVSNARNERNYSWLNCCPGGFFSPDPRNRWSISADKIFDYNSARPHSSMP